MVTAKNILTWLDALAPFEMKMDWDHVGLLCGREDKPIRKVLVALDPFETVVNEAVEKGADLVLTHHPLLFQGPESITTATSLGRAILTLARHDICAINAHTNLDCAPGGVNDILASLLHLENVEILEPQTSSQGVSYGLLRAGTLPARDLEHFLTSVRDTLGCPHLRYVSGGKPVHKVAVGGGSCGSALPAVLAAGCDTFVTADIKYHLFAEAALAGVNLIDAGHYDTESPACRYLLAQLRSAFPELEAEMAENHLDFMKWY